MREYKVSYDTCARVNRLLNPKVSSIKMYIRMAGYEDSLRIVRFEASEKAGFINAVCTSVRNETVIVEMGNGKKIDFFFL